MRKIIKPSIILTFLIFTFSLIIFFLKILTPFELKVYDLLTRYVSPAKKYENICLIYIDQLSIDALSRQGITWPWPRQIYAPLIDYLSEADAIFLDIIFTEDSSYGVEDDKLLAKALERGGNVYLPLIVTKEKKPFDEEYIKKISYTERIPLKDEYNSVIFPIEEFKIAAKGLGNVGILPDEDGIYRQMPLFFRVKEYTIPNFVMSYFIQKNNFQFKQIPLIEGNLLLKYSGDKNPFFVYSFLEILEASISKDIDPKINKEFFKGKTVFIGLTAAGLFDLKPTPISSKTPGVFIHAVAFENLLNKNFMLTAPKFLVLLMIFFISSIIPYTFLRQTSIKINLFVFLFTALILLFMVIVFFKVSFYIQFLPSLACLILSSIITLLYSYATEGKERRFIKRTFTQYMDKKVVDYLLAHPEAIAPGGQKKKVTVFFADIAGFTTISERLSPEDTAMILHKVLNSLTEVVIKNSGVVDKYIGDSIMAFWGAPLESDFDEFNACKAALECIASVKDLNNKFSEKGLPTINIRIGIHTGDVIVGNIGSDRMFNYTVIGDAVNIASRLESVNKFFKTSIIISEETYSKILNIFTLRELGTIRVKGRVKPIRIFEILGRKEDKGAEKLIFTEKYNSAYKLFREKRWTEAKEIFQSLLREYPEDFPSKFYLNLIDKYSVSDQLTKDWFVVKIEEK